MTRCHSQREVLDNHFNHTTILFISIIKVSLDDKPFILTEGRMEKVARVLGVNEDICEKIRCNLLKVK